MPYDCTKFANCWKGAAVIQSCGPGTHFNAKYSVCDWPRKANCKVISSPLPTPSLPSEEGYYLLHIQINLFKRLKRQTSYNFAVLIMQSNFVQFSQK